MLYLKTLRRFCVTGLFTIVLLSSAFAADRTVELRTNAPESKKAIEALQKLGPSRKLIAEVQASGPIYVQFESIPEDYEALWDGNARMIKVNAVHNKSLGRTIGSILFELHNASTNYRLKHLVDLALAGQIAKEDFVVNMERMEHQNAIQTSLILSQGIRNGIFPKEASWPVFHDFDDHYRVQQLHGHSRWIANHYDRVNPSGSHQTYKGTIEGLENFSEQNKQDMLKYLAIKNDLTNPVSTMQQKAARALAAEFGRIEGCLIGTHAGDCSVAIQRAKILDIVFKGHAFYDTLKKESPAYARNY